MIRKANINDLEKIEKLYSDVLDYEETHHFSHWKRGLYPTINTAKTAIENGTMFVGEDNQVLFGSVILNQNQAPEYKNMNWTYKVPDEEILVVHTLCISPFFQKQGKGSELLNFAQDYAKNLGCKYIRLDTHQDNMPAFNLYIKSGFNYVGTAPFAMDYGNIENLKCLDKKL